MDLRGGGRQLAGRSFGSASRWVLAVSVPFVIDRFVYRRKAVRFPWRSRQQKTKGQLAYLIVVPLLGWAILPFYFIRSGTYLNWPQITDGSELAHASRPMSIDRVFVIGAGLMGHGIAQVSAAAGKQVTLSDRTRELAEKGRTRIGANLARQVEKGKLEQPVADEILGA